jgi:hypothetical protein
MNGLPTIREGSCGINNQPQTRTMCSAGEIKGGRGQNRGIHLPERPQIQTGVWPKRGIGAQTNTTSSSQRGSKNLSSCLANRGGEAQTPESFVSPKRAQMEHVWVWLKYMRANGRLCHKGADATVNGSHAKGQIDAMGHRPCQMNLSKQVFFSQESNSVWRQPKSKG